MASMTTPGSKFSTAPEMEVFIVLVCVVQDTQTKSEGQLHFFPITSLRNHTHNESLQARFMQCTAARDQALSVNSIQAV